MLMENHVHLILMTPGGNLQKFMERLNTSYTVSFKRRQRRSGHLFQGRYKAILIDADSYPLELRRYLHLNPVRVKRYSQRELQEKMGIIRSYRWSSYRGYVQPRHRERFLTCSPMLEMVGGGRIVTGQQNRRIKDRETAGTTTPTPREKRDFHFPNAIPFWYPTDNDFAGDLDKSGARKRR